MAVSSLAAGQSAAVLVSSNSSHGSSRSSSSRASATVMASGPSIGSAASALPGVRLAAPAPAGGSAASQRFGPVAVRAVNATNAKSVEKIEWKDKREALLKNGVKSIYPKEALRLQKENGWTILDVRPKYEYEEVHAEGAVSAEIYRLIKEWTAWDILRRAGFAFFGVFNGTEENPDFLQAVEVAGLTKESKIITACGFGGTLKPSQNFREGKESRSLIAAYLLVSEGYKNVYHLEGGLSTWFREEFPVTFKED